MTPSRYRKQGTGVTIHYTIAPTSVGQMLLAATERGICAVHFGDSPATLEHALRAEYPKAEIARSDRKLKDQVKALREIIQGKSTGSLPLDIQATAFQRRVWEELQAIPSHALAQPIRWLLQFRVIVWSGRMAPWEAIAGASIARRSFLRWKVRRVVPKGDLRANAKIFRKH